MTRSFAARVALAVALIVAVWLVWRLKSVVLLAFGATLVAVLLSAVADPIRRRTPLGRIPALLLSVVVLVGVLGGAGWLFGATLAGQLTDLFHRLPESAESARRWVAHLPMGEAVADQLDGAAVVAKVESMAGRLGGVAISLLAAVTNLALVIVAGVYLASAPGAARDGILQLAPPEARAAARKTLDACARALRLWLLGTLADMTVVGVLTALGALVVGLPSPLALGLIAALATFVPIVGPIAGAAPGVLVAAQPGGPSVVWTLVMYFVVQQIEGNLFYPWIQRRAVGLPPVLTLFSVATFSVLFGPLGVLLATPLLVVILVCVRLLYVRETLGEETRLPGEPSD